jgi:hypothetical protein
MEMELALSEALQRRGYIVMNSDRPFEIGHIFPWVDISEGSGMVMRTLHQPMRVMAETGRDDWIEQRDLLCELFFWKPGGQPLGIYYYRLMTD